MNKTSIETIKNPDGTQGYTWNPITGCLNGCEYCYARKLANGRLKSRYLANKNFIAATDITPKTDPFYPRFWEDRLGLPIEHPTPMQPAKRKGIFVCDMSDLFGIGILDEWTEQVMTTIKLCPYHRFYLLTKQPQNLPQWSPFPDNCWVGVTATNDGMMKPAFDALYQIEAKTTYISFEPLLGQIGTEVITAAQYYRWLDWVIIGAQTKPYKPPKIEHVQEIVQACDKAGIPVFLKDNLKPLYPMIPFNDVGYQLRQEMPVN